MKFNGKELKLEITFNTICQLEDMGIDIASTAKSMSMVRGIIAIALGVSVEEAGAEIEQFVINGGDMTTLVKCITDAMESSGFFRALAKTADEGKATVQKIPAKKA